MTITPPKQPRIIDVREWLSTFLAVGLIVFEATVEHSHHPIVYGVGLTLFGGGAALAAVRLTRALHKALEESGTDDVG